MTAFTEVLEARTFIPERHVVLAPNAFADDWQQRPLTEVALGLRRVSDSDIQTARAEAAKYALEMHEDREGQIEAYNDFLMRWAIVRGTCDANDVRLNAPIFEGSEENVRNSLTPNSIRYVWDAIDRFHVETSPLVPEAKDEDLLQLCILLRMPNVLEKLDAGAQKRFRKLAGFLLSEITQFDEPEVEAALTDSE